MGVVLCSAQIVKHSVTPRMTYTVTLLYLVCMCVACRGLHSNPTLSVNKCSTGSNMHIPNYGVYIQKYIQKVIAHRKKHKATVLHNLLLLWKTFTILSATEWGVPFWISASFYLPRFRPSLQNCLKVFSKCFGPVSLQQGTTMQSIPTGVLD